MERRLPDWIDGWMKYTYNSEPCDLYKKWSAISVIAACLRRKCRLEWGVGAEFFPNMYVVLIGPSGARKGTAMGPALQFLRKKGIRLSAECTTQQGLIRELNKSTTGADIDVVTGVMKGQHSSLTIFSPELTVFLGYGMRELISYLTDWYDCRAPWIYRPKDAKLADEIPATWVNMLGATTPELLRATLTEEAWGSGLMSRIIFVYAAKKGKTVPIPTLTPEEAAIKEDLLADLDHIMITEGEYRMENDFWTDWVSWYTEHSEDMPFDSRKFDGYCARRPLHILKLCMIMNASRDGGMILSRDDLSRALSTLLEVEKPMEQTFGGIGTSRLADVQYKVMRVIQEKGTIKASELLHLFHQDITRRDLEDVMLALRDMQFCHFDNTTDPSDTIISIL